MIAVRAWLNKLFSSKKVAPHRNARPSRPLVVECLERRDMLSAAHMAIPILQRRLTGNATTPIGNGYTPAQIRTAYGINGIASGDSGTGQSIAIVDAYNNPNIINDLDVFDQNMTLTTGGASLYSLYGHAASVLTVYDQNGSHRRWQHERGPRSIGRVGRGRGIDGWNGPTPLLRRPTSTLSRVTAPIQAICTSPTRPRRSCRACPWCPTAGAGMNTTEKMGTTPRSPNQPAIRG